jgi:hypothetical protein
VRAHRDDGRGYEVGKNCWRVRTVQIFLVTRAIVSHPIETPFGAHLMPLFLVRGSTATEDGWRVRSKRAPAFEMQTRRVRVISFGYRGGGGEILIINIT